MLDFEVYLRQPLRHRPTFLEAAGLKPPAGWHGRSLVPLLAGRTPEDWRRDFLYHYEWEQDYPYTPTIVGLRTQTHSLMQYWGVWDLPELYDLRTDPDQLRNLLADARITYGRGRYTNHIKAPETRKLVLAMQDRLAEILAATGGDPRYSGKGSEGDVFAL